MPLGPSSPPLRRQRDAREGKRKASHPSRTTACSPASAPALPRPAAVARALPLLELWLVPLLAVAAPLGLQQPLADVGRERRHVRQLRRKILLREERAASERARRKGRSAWRLGRVRETGGAPHVGDRVGERRVVRVALAVAEVLHQLGRRVADVDRDLVQLVALAQADGLAGGRIRGQSACEPTAARGAQSQPEGRVNGPRRRPRTRASTSAPRPGRRRSGPG